METIMRENLKQIERFSHEDLIKNIEESTNTYDKISRRALHEQLMGNFKQAVSYYEEALKLKGDKDYLLKNNLGILYMQLLDKENCRKYFLEALNAQYNEFIQLNYLLTFLSFRDYSEGLANYEKIIDKKLPKIYQTALYNNFANLNFHTGNIETAREYYLKCLNSEGSVFKAHADNKKLCDEYDEQSKPQEQKEKYEFDKIYFKKYAPAGHKARIAFLVTDLKRSYKCLVLKELIKILTNKHFEVFVYTDSIGENKISIEISAMAETINTYSYSNGRLANKIINDKINIIFDLNESSPRNRSELFNLNLNAVKASYFSLCEDISNPLYDLKLKINSNLLSRYLPIPVLEEKLTGFELEKNIGTFYIGIIGDLKRINGETMKLIKKTLSLHENVRIIIQSIVLDDELVCENLKNKLKSYGAPIEKISFIGKLKPYSKYLSLIQSMDCLLIDRFGSVAALLESISYHTPSLVNTQNKAAKNIYENLNLPELIFNNDNFIECFDILIKKKDCFKEKLNKKQLENYNRQFSDEFIDLIYSLCENNNLACEPAPVYDDDIYLDYILTKNGDMVHPTTNCYGDTLFLSLF